MTQLANLKATFFQSLGKIGIIPARTLTEAPISGDLFDRLHIDDADQAPVELPALFASRERGLGNPARLFPGRAGKAAEAKHLRRVKRQWLDVLDGLKPYGLRGQITGINTHLNRSTDAPALASLGQAFPWTAPLNIFHNAGSEHIAFAKYLSLRKIGVNAERLRLVWIEDGHTQANRVVLAATFGGRNYILDSHRHEIAPDDALPHFKPYCSSNKLRFSLHWDGQQDKGWESALRQLGTHAVH